MPHLLVDRKDQPPYLPTLKSFTGTESAKGTRTLHIHNDRVTFIHHHETITYKLEEATLKEPTELRSGYYKFAVVQFVDSGRKIEGKVGDCFYKNKIYYTLEAEIGEASGGYTLNGHFFEEGVPKMLELTGFKTDA